MAEIHEPVQETIRFVYIQSQETIYVQDNIIVKINYGESLEMENQPTLDSVSDQVPGTSTYVNYKVKKIINDTYPYTKEVLIPLLRGIKEKEPNLEIKLRGHIQKDLDNKNICCYCVKSKVTRLDNADIQRRINLINPAEISSVV